MGGRKEERLCFERIDAGPAGGVGGVSGPGDDVGECSVTSLGTPCLLSKTTSIRSVFGSYFLLSPPGAVGFGFGDGSLRLALVVLTTPPTGRDGMRA